MPLSLRRRPCRLGRPSIVFGSSPALWLGKAACIGISTSRNDRGMTRPGQPNANTVHIRPDGAGPPTLLAPARAGEKTRPPPRPRPCSVLAGLVAAPNGGAITLVDALAAQPGGAGQAIDADWSSRSARFCTRQLWPLCWPWSPGFAIASEAALSSAETSGIHAIRRRGSPGQWPQRPSRSAHFSQCRRRGSADAVLPAAVGHGRTAERRRARMSLSPRLRPAARPYAVPVQGCTPWCGAPPLQADLHASSSGGSAGLTRYDAPHLRRARRPSDGADPGPGTISDAHAAAFAVTRWRWQDVHLHPGDTAAGDSCRGSAAALRRASSPQAFWIGGRFMGDGRRHHRPCGVAPYSGATHCA